MREYLVINRSDTGRPIYSKDNEDMLTALMMALLGFILEYSDLTNLPSVNNIEVSKESPLNRAMEYITPRSISPGNSHSLFERYGAVKRRPVFETIVRSMGMGYNYTQDGRPEELRPEVKTAVRRDMGNRYRSDSGGLDNDNGRRPPSRRLF
jgi:hypothetical protein